MTWSADDAPMQVDTYLDELLATRARYVRVRDEATAELAHAAAVVRDALVRFHPSFRFEEELAARLRAVAGGAVRAAGAASVVVFPAPGMTLAPAGAPALSEAEVDPSLAALESAVDDPDAAPAERGWMLVGGAIASGVSLAAGVLLARRRSRHDDRWGGVA
jgi:hypothetical protein